MLDLENEGGRLRLIDAINQLPCTIELPESWTDFFNDTGPTRGEVDERRQFPRWKVRALAGLMYRNTFPEIERAESWHPVYLKDVSRGGAALIHSEQLFPLEQVRILFIDDVSSRILENYYLRAAEVVRCRYIQPRCYEVGARFVRGQ